MDVNEDKGDGDVLNNSLKPEVDRWSFIDDEEDERQGSLLLIKRGGCLPFKYSNFQQIYKINRCLARYSPRATTTNRPINRALNKSAWRGPN